MLLAMQVTKAWTSGLMPDWRTQACGHAPRIAPGVGQGQASSCTDRPIRVHQGVHPGQSGTPFVLKQQFGHVKVRCRRLKRNTAQIFTLCALSNLWIVRHKLLAMGQVRVQGA